MRLLLQVVIALSALAPILPLPCSAQSAASLTGSITDPYRAVISDVKEIAKNIEAGLQSIVNTSAGGLFSRCFRFSG